MRRWLLALLTFAALAAAAPVPAFGGAASGRPGRILDIAAVDGSHYNPCAPGGLEFDFTPAYYPCWQAWLASPASPRVGRSRALRRHTQFVTLTRRIYRTWLPTDPFALSVERSVTQRIGPRGRTTRFPAWTEVTDTGFGYHTVLYTLVWQSASGRVLGKRTKAVADYRCQTQFPCGNGWQWIWLGDTD